MLLYDSVLSNDSLTLSRSFMSGGYLSGSYLSSGFIRVATSPGLHINLRATGSVFYSPGHRKIRTIYTIIEYDDTIKSVNL